jgi:hypothetical protein
LAAGEYEDQSAPSSLNPPLDRRLVAGYNLTQPLIKVCGY